MNKAIFLGLGSATLALIACGSSDSTGTSTTSGGGGASSAASTSSHAATSGSGGSVDAFACASQPSKLALGGTWAARGSLEVTLQAKPGGAITACPADQLGESSLILLLDFTADTSDATRLSSVKATLCSIELPTVKALVGKCSANAPNLVTVELHTPEAFLAALPGIATQPVTGTLSSTSPGASLSLDRFTVTVGSSKPAPNMPSWDTTSPSCTDMTIGHQAQCDSDCVDDCAAVVDADGDGFPGATIEICGTTDRDVQTGVKCSAAAPATPGTTLQGRGFLDIQVDPQFTGKVVSSCEITGNVDTQVLYNLLGADIYLAGTPIGVTAAIESLPSFDVKSSASKFRMVRIDGEFGAPDWNATGSPAAACAALLKHQTEF